jgi:hypothetical protein
MSKQETININGRITKIDGAKGKDGNIFLFKVFFEQNGQRDTTPIEIWATVFNATGGKVPNQIFQQIDRRIINEGDNLEVTNLFRKSKISGDKTYYSYAMTKDSTFKATPSSHSVMPTASQVLEEEENRNKIETPAGRNLPAPGSLEKFNCPHCNKTIHISGWSTGEK